MVQTDRLFLKCTQKYYRPRKSIRTYLKKVNARGLRRPGIRPMTKPQRLRGSSVVVSIKEWLDGTKP